MIEDIKRSLAVSFDANPIFDKNNIGNDNTFEDKTITFILKLSQIFNVNFDNLYEKLKTFSLKPLSIYSNKGFVDYNPVENVGYLSLTALQNDEDNNFNIDNLFNQILLMVLTSKDNYYGFGNEEILNSLNRACTYMIASNLSGSAQKNFHEEELITLNLLDLTLEGTKSNIDFVTSYLQNNGTILKQELNKYGITDDILNEINYLSQAKMSKLNMPEQFARIENKINRNFALQVSNGVIVDRDIISRYQSNLLNDEVLDYSHNGMDKTRSNMVKAVDYLNQQRNININNGQVMQKV